MKLLLINPKLPESFWSFKWVTDTVLTNKRTTNPPLGLATLAALCPQEWEVKIIDENIESIPLEPRADIIVMFGRKPRTKSLEQVGRELDLLRQLNVHNPFFVDDNLIGDKPRAKELLKFLKGYQREHDYWFSFGTEASLNMAEDDELLALFREANFKWVFIGIESPDENSLKETKKFQNIRHDILSSVRKIYSYGIDIYGGFIVGFDNDMMETFDQQYDFITQSGIQAAMIGLLTALPKTPLYDRLKKEDRLIPQANHADNTKLATNIIPKQMAYDEMVSGYRRLYDRLLDQRNIAERIKNKTRHLANPVYGGQRSADDVLMILRKFFVRGLVPGGISRIFHFVRTIPFFKPRLIPLVIQDWIIGLSMRDYVDRHFVEEFEEANRLTHRYLWSIERAFQRYLRHGVLEVSLHQVKNAAANLSISFKGFLDKKFFTRAGRHFEKLLAGTTSSLTLHIEELHESHLLYLNRLLDRLAQHGDRITVTVHEKLLEAVEIDSSVFNLVLKNERC
jgi:Domain of unknown function (DUF4070)/Radical SAM superfamily